MFYSWRQVNGRATTSCKETGLYGVAMVLQQGRRRRRQLFIDNADPQPLQVPGTSSGPGAMKVHVGTIHLPPVSIPFTLRLG